MFYGRRKKKNAKIARLVSVEYFRRITHRRKIHWKTNTHHSLWIMRSFSTNIPGKHKRNGTTEQTKRTEVVRNVCVWELVVRFISRLSSIHNFHSFQCYLLYTKIYKTPKKTEEKNNNRSFLCIGIPLKIMKTELDSCRFDMLIYFYFIENTLCIWMCCIPTTFRSLNENNFI